MTDMFTPTDVTPQVENAYEVLVGEGKKFADPNALAAAKIESDRFIEQLKREQAEMREELNKRMTAEEILTQIKAASPTPVTPAPQEPVKQDVSDVNELVRKAITEQTQTQQRAANMASVTNKLAEKFGAEAQIQLNKKAQELGVTLDYLKNQAAENPAVFYKLIDLDRPVQQLPTAVAPRGTIQTPITSGERDRNYYDKQKTANPKWYFSEEGRMQQYKDMERALKAGKAW